MSNKHCDHTAPVSSCLSCREHERAQLSGFFPDPHMATLAERDEARRALMSLIEAIDKTVCCDDPEEYCSEDCRAIGFVASLEEVEKARNLIAKWRRVS